MTFPAVPLPVSGQLYINGAWVDVTSRIRGSGDVTINRGRSNEQARLAASTCDFTLNNRNGDFSDRNPLSPYFQKLPRNIPTRIGVTESSGVAMSVGEYYNSAPYAQTTDKAALDIVGDIDIRFDITPTSWTPRQTVIIGGKLSGTTNQHSWVVILYKTGVPGISWTTDGTSATRKFAYANAIPATSGRKSIRIVLDVDNGAGGYTCTFSTASSIGGTYTTLGSAATGAGVTSIFSGSAPLAAGTTDGIFPFSNVDHFSGRFHAMEVRNSVGTLVAKADFTAQTAGATSWADGLGNTWNVSGTATELTASNIRHTGELSSLPTRWDSTGRDVYCPVTSSGVIQRLTQGTDPLHSPIYRNLNQRTLTGWYPGEDESGSTSIASAVAGVRNANYVDVTPSTDTDLPGSDGVLVFNSSTSYMSGAALDTGSNTGSTQFLCYFRFPTVPVADIELVSVYMQNTGSTNISKYTITVTSTTYRLDVYDLAGASLLSSAILHGAGSAPNQWMIMKVDLVQSGGNVAWAIGWYALGAPLLYGLSGTFAGTVSRLTGFIIWDRPGRDGMKFAHAYLSQIAYVFDDYRFLGASAGYVGETALDRLIRLCVEENVPFVYRGYAVDTELMGRQTAKEFMDLVYECVDADGGMLFEPRELIGLGYLTRANVRNVTGPQLAYSGDLWGEIQPYDDDQLIRNDVTVSRPFGSTARATLDTGRMSVLPSTQGGAGRYSTAPSINVSSDNRLRSLAQYIRQLGTIDETRYTGIRVNLARAALLANSAKTESLKRLDIGGNLGMTGMPRFGPPDDVDMLVQGIKEVIANSDRSREWSFQYHTSPYDPYRINDLSLSSSSLYRASATNSTLVTGINSTALSMSIATPTGALWGTTATSPGNFPLNVMMGGELMTISGIVNSTSPQTFTISARSVNGVVKSHLATTSIDVAQGFDATL